MVAKKASAKRDKKTPPSSKPTKKPTPPHTKKPLAKKAERDATGKVKIAFMNRTEDAISEVRENIVALDPFTELLDIRKGYIEIFENLKKQSNPKYEQVSKTKHLRYILDERHKNVMDLLNKLVPSFSMESINNALQEAKDGADGFDADATRAEAFAKLLKGLKSK